MKLALDKFADNPIIDELLCRWDNQKKIGSLRASAPIWRKPFIEIGYLDGTNNHMQFPRELFIHYWSEAVIVLETLTDIGLISEFKCQPTHNQEATIRTALSTRAACIRDSDTIFESGFYQVYLDQFGCNCKNLPPETIEKLETARSRV
ncbi:MAG: hypothetical protein GY763_06820 [Gammaproteobacteria bacterium]|nr:hypothetical protein [Gammaproteobacteria bacterium]